MSTTASEGVELPWQRLHPASLLVNLVPRAWSVLRSSWPLLLALVWGRSAEAAAGLADISILLVFFVLTLASTAVHFFTLRYRVGGGQLQIRSGLLNRQMRTIDVARIQNIERTRNIFQRAAGLVEVRVETASGREVEGLLSALSNRAAGELIEAVRSERSALEEPEDAPTEEILVRNGPEELLRYGATATRWGLAVVMAGGAVELLQWTDPAQLGGLFQGASAGAALVAALTGTWLLGVGGAVVRHWGFRLVRTGEDLSAQEGLFTTRTVLLRPGKVQRVSILEPLLRRLLGAASVRIETAAAGRNSQGTRSSQATVPLVGREDAAPLADEVLHGEELERVLVELLPPHPNAQYRAWIGSSVRGLLVGAGLFWWQGPWGALGFFAVPLFILFAHLDFRWQGWAVTDALVVARRGWLGRQTVLAPRRKVQSATRVQGLLMRRWGLGRVVVQVAGSVVELPDLGEERCAELVDKLADLPST